MNKTTSPLKVTLIKEYESIPEGSCIHVTKELKNHYKGIWSFMGGSLNVKVKKEFCRIKS